MKNKSLKIFLISMIFVVFATKCMAVNIDMDLGANLVDQNVLSNSEMVDQIENVENTMSNSSSNTSSNSESAGNVQASNQIGGSVDSSTKSNSSVFSVLPESELGLTNVLNILLIAVGFVLILLAIAIIIKLKN